MPNPFLTRLSSSQHLLEVWVGSSPDVIFPKIPEGKEDARLETYVRLAALSPDLQAQVREAVGISRDDSRHTPA